jgi:hypothetical protein
MVEYALIAASVAFVAVAGWSVLRDHEVAYFGSLPVQATPASAPGALLHPTAIEPPNCTSNRLLLGEKLNCSFPRVFDVLSNPADRSAPLGTITWFIDGVPIPDGTCALQALTADSSTCGTGLMPLTLANASLADNWHQVWAAYTSPTTNHLPSTGSQFRLFIQRWQLFPGFGSHLCSNLVTGQLDRVEIGHPITCSARIVDLAPELPNTEGFTWEASGNRGRGVFTCATNGDLSLLWNKGCAPAATWTCDPRATDCTVVYHRLNDSDGPIGVQTDTVRIVGHGLDKTMPVRIELPVAHGSAIWARCEQMPTGTFQVQARQTTFVATETGEVKNTSLSCTAYVVDVDPNSALDCTQAPLACSAPGANPDANTAFAPLGNVTWDSPALQAPQSCPLKEESLTSVPLAQVQGVAPGQVDSVASCSVLLTFQSSNPGGSSGGSSNTGEGNGEDVILTVTYTGSSQHTGSPYQVHLRLLSVH